VVFIGPVPAVVLSVAALPVGDASGGAAAEELTPAAPRGGGRGLGGRRQRRRRCHGAVGRC